METIIIPRIFRFKNGQHENDIYLQDLGRERSGDQIRQIYAATYPILTTARTAGPEFEQVNGTLSEVYTFETTFGAKG